MNEQPAIIQPRTKTLLDYADRLPPYIVWMLARELGSRGKPIPLPTIAARAGMHPKRVVSILKRGTWADVTIGEFDRIRPACGVTPENEHLHREFLRRATQRSKRPFRHLDYLSRKQRKRIAKAMAQVSAVTQH